MNRVFRIYLIRTFYVKHLVVHKIISLYVFLQLFTGVGQLWKKRRS